jgi:hypothetical protein
MYDAARPASRPVIARRMAIHCRRVSHGTYGPVGPARFADFRPYRSATNGGSVTGKSQAWHISQAAAVKILLRTGLKAAPRPRR